MWPVAATYTPGVHEGYTSPQFRWHAPCRAEAERDSLAGDPEVRPARPSTLSNASNRADDMGHGAIAAFSPSSLSVHSSARICHQALGAELASGRHSRLGDAILAAQETYADHGAPPDIPSVYQLLGDPALRIQ